MLGQLFWRQLSLLAGGLIVAIVVAVIVTIASRIAGWVGPEAVFTAGVVAALSFSFGMLTIVRRSGDRRGLADRLRDELRILRDSPNRASVVLLMATSITFSCFVAFTIAQYGRSAVIFLHPPVAIWGLWVVAMVIVSPVAEELYFRRWMWDDFGLVFGPWATGAWVCVLFTAMHMIPHAGMAVIILPLAIVLSAVRARSGSIAPGIALHVFNNALVLHAQGLV